MSAIVDPIGYPGVGNYTVAHLSRLAALDGRR
jgi:hypothetical protein